MIDSGPAKTSDPDAASLKPARAGIDNHTKANPHTIGMRDPKKMVRERRRDFSRSDRNGRFIYEKRSFPVAIILLTNQTGARQRVEVYDAKGWRFNPNPLFATIKKRGQL